MHETVVSIVRTPKSPDYGAVVEAVRRAVDLAGGLDGMVGAGQSVLINPSWVADPGERSAGACTWPEVSRAVADLVKERGARPIIAESSAVGVDCEKVIQSSGHAELRGLGYEVVNLKELGAAELPVPGGGVVFDPVPVFGLVAEVDAVISVPVLKTHDQTEMTCAIKKLKGLLPDKVKRAFHREGLFDACIDLLLATRPCLAVVDAIVCQEGLGPIFGDPVEMDLIIAGKDLVAVDSVCARLIGYEPEETLLTVKGAERGAGVMDPARIRIVGEPLEAVKRRFVRAHEANPVGEIEGFRLIHGQVACTGCRNTVLSSLIDMKNSDQLVYLPGITVLTGDADPPAGVEPEDVVTVGKCMAEERRTKRHVKGCPPNNVYVVEAIIGGRAEVKRRY